VSSSGGVAVDPYALSGVYPGQSARNADTAGLTRVSPVLTGAAKVIIFIGQSNIASFVGNFGDTPYTPSNTLVQMFDVSSGALFNAVDVPMIGCNGPVGNVPIRIGDQLRTAGVARVILANIAIGGTPVSAWAAGGVLNGDIAVMVKRLNAVGLTPTHIVWAQGEQDAILGTARATYAASLNSVISTFRNLGVTCPFLVTKSTYQGGAVNATIQAAYTDVIDNVTVFAGADTDTINSGRIANVHFTQAQANTAAGLHVTAIQAH
jgi:hypothetical protein